MAKVGQITLDDLYEIMTDEKTFVIVDMLKNGERTSAEMIAESKIFYKTFNYIVVRMYNAGMLNSRATMKTRIYSLNKDGINVLIEKLKAISGQLCSAADKLAALCF